MNYGEAKKYLIKPVATSTEIGDEKQKEFDAFTLAMIAFEKLDMIQRIIDVPSFDMEGDVTKYLMIRQVMKNV